MGLDSIRIKLSGDAKDMQPILDNLIAVGKIDKANAEQFVKTTKIIQVAMKQQEDAVKKVNSQFNDMGKAVKAGTATDGINNLINRTELLRATNARLGGSINQLSRELPAFAVSANTGFMAISNNIPALVDALDSIKKKNLELAASGQQTISPLKSLASALFSFNTLISVGVTLLTVYGGKIAELAMSFFALDKAANLSNETQSAYWTSLNKLIEKNIENQLKLNVLRGKMSQDEADRFKINYEQQKLMSQAEQEFYKHRKELAEKFKVDVSKITGDLQEFEVGVGKAGVKFQNEQMKQNEKINAAFREIEKLHQDKLNEIKRGAQLEDAQITENARIKREKKEEEERKRQLDAYQKLKKQISDLQEVLKVQITLGIASPETILQLNKLEEELDRIDAKFKMLTEDLQKTPKIEIAKNYSDELKKQLDKQYEDELKAADAKLQLAIKTNAEIAKAKAEADKKQAEIDRQNKQAETQLAIQGLTQIADAAISFERQQADQALRLRLDSIEKQRDSELSNKRLTEAQKESINKKFAAQELAAKKKAFEEDRQLARTELGLRTALAVITAFTTPDPTFGILTAERVAAILTVSAIQLAQINAQKFEKGGRVKGKRHSQGGVNIEAEADEWIINRKDSIENDKLLEATNKGRAKQFIHKNYVLPAVLNAEKAAKREMSFAQNVANSMLLNSDKYDDYKLRKTIESTSRSSTGALIKSFGKLKSNRKVWGQ